MANNTINTFIKGIKADTAPIDAPNSAATDIVNGELLTDNGNQMILQPAKSNVPVTGFDAEYEVETFFVDMSNGEGIGDLLTIDVTKKLHSIYFTLGPQGQGDFLNITFTLNYNNGSTETAGPFGADMFAQSGSDVETYSGTYFLYAYDNKNSLKSVSFRTGSEAPVILKYTLYYYQENDIGLGENTKILGVKEYNDVAYIVSANRLTEFYNGSASNNVNKTAYDDMDLGSVEDDRDLPHPNNSVKIKQNSSLNEQTNKLLYNFDKGNRLTGTKWYYQGNFKDLDPLIDVLKIDKAGKYIIEIIFKFYADAFSSNLHHHKAWVQYFLNDEAHPLTEQVNNNADYHSSNEPIIIDVSLPVETASDGEVIKMRYEQTVCDNGRIKYWANIETKIIDAPKEVIEESNIEIETIEVNPAYSVQFSDGEIFIKKAEEVNTSSTSGDSGTSGTTGGTDTSGTTGGTDTSGTTGGTDTSGTTGGTDTSGTSGDSGTSGTGSDMSDISFNPDASDTSGTDTSSDTSGTDTSSDTSASSSDSNTYMVALEHRDWIEVNEGEGYTFTNLASGDYNVYIKKGTDILKTPVHVPERFKTSSTGIKALITNLNDYVFHLKLTPYDYDFDQGDEYTVYSGKYKIGYYDEFNPGNKYEQIISINETAEFDVNLTGPGLIITYCESETGNTNRITAAVSSYTRKSVLEIPITESMNNSKYGVEIGTFPAPENYNVEEGKLIDVYKPLQNLDYHPFKSNDIRVTDENYFDVEIQPSYDNSVNIIFTDKNNDIRIVNSGFAVLPGGNYKLLDSDQNQYNSKNVDVKARLMQISGTIPKLDVVAVNNSMGKLKPGTYKYFIKFSTEDGNETDIVEESGLIPVFFGSTMGDARGGKSDDETTKSISLRISGIDKSYTYIKLLYLINTGDEVVSSRAFEILKQYKIPTNPGEENEVIILHTGYENIVEIPIENLSVNYDHIKSIKTITQLQNRLFVANFGKENIDYYKLFKASEKIFAVPTKTISGINIGETAYSLWDSQFSDLESLSYKFFTQKIETDNKLTDINNNISNLNRINLINILSTQGFHNPMVVEKFAGYWPYETYKLGICFIMNNDKVSNPVPVSSTDFYEYQNISEEEIINAFTNIEFEDQENWKQDNEYHIDFNNIGIIRFPKMDSPKTIYYPKFQFSKKELFKKYPEFFLRVKGFFFVRAERKENIILTGAILNCAKMVTNPNNIQDFTNKGGYPEVPVFDGSEDISDVSVVPIPVFDNNAEQGYKIIVGMETFNNPSDPEDLELTSSGIQTYDVIPAWLAKYSRNFIDNYKYAVYSGDLIDDTARAVASFNGTKYGLLGLNKFYVNNYLKTVEQKVYQRLTALNTFSNMDEPGIVNKVATDFIPSGQSSRSGGGFASYIPFKSCKIVKNDNGVSSYYFPTGVYESFMGISVSGEILQNFGVLFSDIDGPLSHNALMQKYSMDESTLYVPITRRYKFSEFKDNETITITGTRGDCFISQNVFSIVNSDTTIAGGVTSTRETLKDPDSGEYNSFRVKDFAVSFLMAHQTNYLSFLRSLEVHDVQETAEFGKPRGFLPYDSESEKLLVKTHSNRIIESTKFNKGYKAHFTGRKYASISKNNVYIESKNQNDIMFSDVNSDSDFQNGYRKFSALNVYNYNKEFGAINKIVSLGNYLIVIHTKGITALPVNESTMIQNSNGKNINIRSMEVLPEQSIPLSEIYGSIYPESICKTDNAIYGIDTLKKKIWMTVGKAVKIISDDGINRLLSGFLYDFQNKESIPGELYIKALYNKRSHQVIFSFYNKDSRLISRAVEMDIDLYYFLYSMTDFERETWINEAKTKEEKVERKKMVEYFKNIYTFSQPVKFLTLVYNEILQTWETRYNYSPEFGFNINGSFYTINNLETSKNFTSEIFTNGANRQLIWKHGGNHPGIPPYGSFYGETPVFEVEYVSNQNPKNKKIFHTINVIGTEAKPSQLIYHISPQCPWFQVLIDRYPGGVGAMNDEQIREQYYDLILSNGYKPDEDPMHIVNPNIYVVQDIYDRRNTSITKANYNYVKGYNKIIISKNLKSLYYTDKWENKVLKNMGMRFKDVYLKVRLVYKLGNYLYIKGVETLFNY